MNEFQTIRTWLSAVLLLGAAAPAPGQVRGVDLSYGRWWNGSAAVSYSAGYFSELLGPLAYGLGVTHLAEGSATDDRRRTGGEFSLALSRGGPGPYAVASAGLSMGHSSGRVDAQWSAGVGYSFSPLRFLSVAVESRYRVEDTAVRGFWRLQPDDRRGVMLLARVTVGVGNREPGPRTLPAAPARELRPPSDAELIAAAGDGESDGTAANQRALVVQTALDAMGTPYRWGGTDGNGFDCSGLIRYAYGEHGLILPRISRDQARTGTQVQRSVNELVPGDILGFGEGGRITHVGLYVGDGKFLHSSSEGVRLSSLTATAGDGTWWQRRWVNARRVIN
jgi:hypothetical protein